MARLRVGAANLGSMLREYFGLGRPVRAEPVDDTDSLKRFLETRASFIAQTSLYGYLRTRAGLRYPALFDDEAFVVSIDIAKWHMWLACLSDLTVYAGGLVAARSRAPEALVGSLMSETLAAILDATGHPDRAGHEFPAHAERVVRRVEETRWHRVGDDEQPFSESPAALVRYAPIVEEMKRLDEAIVRNSVRFHWQEIRRELRRQLDAHALLETTSQNR